MLCNNVLFVTGTVVDSVDVSVSFANIISLSMMIFGGFYVRMLPVFVKWLKYLSILKYAYDALVQIQFTDQTNISCEGGAVMLACLENKVIILCVYT